MNFFFVISINLNLEVPCRCGTEEDNMNKRKLRKEIKQMKKKQNRVALNKVRNSELYISTVEIKSCRYFETALLSVDRKGINVLTCFSTYKNIQEAKKGHNYYLAMTEKKLLELSENC